MRRENRERRAKHQAMLERNLAIEEEEAVQKAIDAAYAESRRIEKLKAHREAERERMRLRAMQRQHAKSLTLLKSLQKMHRREAREERAALVVQAYARRRLGRLAAHHERSLRVQALMSQHHAVWLARRGDEV